MGIFWLAFFIVHGDWDNGVLWCSLAFLFLHPSSVVRVCSVGVDISLLFHGAAGSLCWLVCRFSLSPYYTNRNSPTRATVTPFLRVWQVAGSRRSCTIVGN